MVSKKVLQEALKIAADALDIADDWELSDIQVNPPKEWGLAGDDGWCRIRALARKLRELAKAA